MLVLVCSLVDELLPKLRERPIIFRLDDIRKIGKARETALRYNINLRGLWVRTESLLCDLKPKDDWHGIPIALEAGGAGPFRKLNKKLDAYNSCDLRFFLPADSETAALDLRVLASLGYNCGIAFRDNLSKVFDWEPIGELATYAMYGTSPHGDIDPFSFIIRNFEPGTSMDWSAVYLEDPKRFVHVDIHGNLSVLSRGGRTRIDLRATIDEFDRLAESKDYQRARDSWKEHFLNLSSCSSCEGWPVCMGMFGEACMPQCSELFSEVLGVAEKIAEVRQKGAAPWPP